MQIEVYVISMSVWDTYSKAQDTLFGPRYWVGLLSYLHADLLMCEHTEADSDVVAMYTDYYLRSKMRGWTGLREVCVLADQLWMVCQTVLEYSYYHKINWYIYLVQRFAVWYCFFERWWYEEPSLQNHGCIKLRVPEHRCHLQMNIFSWFLVISFGGVYRTVANLAPGWLLCYVPVCCWWLNYYSDLPLQGSSCNTRTSTAMVVDELQALQETATRKNSH